MSASAWRLAGARKIKTGGKIDQGHQRRETVSCVVQNPAFHLHGPAALQFGQHHVQPGGQ
jgi:hypothetical protein